jgi:hypothetical protein
MKTQTQKILQHLQSGKPLTPITALNKFGCFRLAARISDLRKDGHTIFTETVTKGKKTFASYRYNGNIKMLS